MRKSGRLSQEVVSYFEKIATTCTASVRSVYISYRNGLLIGLLFVTLTKYSMSLEETSHVSSRLTYLN